MSTTLGNTSPAKTSACAEYPQVFSSPYLEDFDEVSFLEAQEDKGIENDEAVDLIPAARARHEEIQPRAVAAAKDICSQCPLLAECKDWVLSLKDQSEVYGVVAGMTLVERRSARRAISRQNSKSLRNRSSVTVPATVDVGGTKTIQDTAQRLLHVQ